MPALGTSNNNLGINSYSGPLGEKEPAYGAVERASVLSRLAPVGSPQALNAPKRAKRRAVKGKTAPPPPQPVSAAHNIPVETTGPGVPAGGQPGLGPTGPYQQQLLAFWQEAAMTPGASDEVKQYAAQLGVAAPAAPLAAAAVA